MKRVNFHLTEQQVERLKSLSVRTGLAVADLIRRAVDAMLSKEKDGERRGRGERE